MITKIKYIEILKVTGFCFVIFIFIGFSWFLTESFSGQLQDFIYWKIAKNSNFYTSSIQDSGIEKNLLPLRNWDIANLETQAESAIAVNIEDNKQKIIYEKNKEAVLPIASITKLVTALLVVENYNLNEKIIISKSAKEKKGSLVAGDEFFANDLLKLMLVESDNTAAYALSEINDQENFVTLMNEKVKELGMINTSFDNSVGIGPNCKSNTQDLIILAKYIQANNPEIFELSTISSFDLFDVNGKLKRNVKNINQLLFDTSTEFKDKVIGGKTGSNPFAGECLLLIAKSFDNKGYIITVVLNAGKNIDDRFIETKNIINWVKIAYKWK